MSRTRFFQFAVVAFLLGLLMVECRPRADPLYNAKHKEFTSSKRKLLLYNRCSGQHLQLPTRRVCVATGQYDLLLVRDVDLNSTVSIRGSNSKAFLCFNKKGKLHARFQFKKELCAFEEKIDDNMYTTLWLRRPGEKPWKVGFDIRGKPLKGNSYLKGKKSTCFQFLKRQVSEEETTAAPASLGSIYPRKSRASKALRARHPVRHSQRRRSRRAVQQDNKLVGPNPCVP